MTEIKEKINEIFHNGNINNKDFEDNYINVFLNSWKNIKHKAIQYKCKDLEKAKDLTKYSELAYFLVDDGEIGYGMYLASAYEQMIQWQNKFIDYIIVNNSMNGILNSYISLLEQEVDIQDATNDEILKIDESIYKSLDELIYSCSMRNIFSNEGKINYKNYNDIIYIYDYIESELGKKILPGIKKFKYGKIKFVTYLYEGFRGKENSILIDINNKYPQRDLSDEEKNQLNKFLKLNNSSQFNNEVFSSLQILMNYIIKDYYDPNELINKIICSLPDFVMLNKTFKDFFKKYEKQKLFTINSILSIYEYVELLCWKEMKEKISKILQLEIKEEKS